MKAFARRGSLGTVINISSILHGYKQSFMLLILPTYGWGHAVIINTYIYKR